MSDRQSRSDHTRERIASSARHLFASLGYERTTIRAVASGACIDPAMVIRYFGSKDGLFAAVTEFDLRLPDLSDVPREQIGERLVRHFLSRWEDDDDDGLVVLLRSAVSNDAARERMRLIVRNQIMPMVAGVIADEKEAALRAELLVSQILGVALCRFVLGLPALSADNADAIVNYIAPVVEMHLFGSGATGAQRGNPVSL